MKSNKNFKITKKDLFKIALEANREKAKAQGFFQPGRFATKTIESKKKIQHLKIRRSPLSDES